MSPAVNGLMLWPFIPGTVNLFRDKMYIYGVKTGNPSVPSTDVWVFDPLLKELRVQSTYGVDAPVNPVFCTADVCERLSVMAVYGGIYADSPRTLWILDLSVWMWTNPETKGEAPLRRATHASCVVDSTLYIYNRGTSVRETEDDFFMIDLAERKNLVWHKLPFRGGNVDGRLDATMVYVGRGRIMVFGGYNSRGSRGSTNDLLVIDDLLSPGRTCRKVVSQDESLLGKRGGRLRCLGERPSPREEATMLFAHNKVYLLGGGFDDKWCYFELLPA